MLAWMQKEFQALRSQLYSLSTSLTYLQSTLSKFADGRTTELNVSLAEIEGCTAELRAEAAKLRDHEKALADRMDEASGPGPEVRAALAEMERSAREVHAEIAMLRDFREAMMRQVPEIVAGAVREALLQAAVVAGLVPAGTPAGDDSGLAASSAASPAAASPAAAPAAARQAPPAPSATTAGSAAAVPVAPAPPATHQGDAARPSEVSPTPVAAPPDPTTAARGPGEGPGAAGNEPPASAITEPAATSTELPAPAVAAIEVTSPATAAEGPGSPAGDSPVCTLPGLRVGPSLAAGVTTALVSARLRHRRRRRAGIPGPGMRRHDRFTGPITGALERFALVRGLGAAGNGAVKARRESPVHPGLIPIADRQGDEVSCDLGAHQPLVVVGPEAADAARAMVTSLLMLNPPTHAATIVVGDLLPGVPSFPGFGHTPALGSVVGGLITELDRRAALVQDAGLPDVAAYRVSHPEATVPLLLIASPEAPPADDPQWRRVLDEGGRLGVAMLVVGTPVAGAATIRLQGGGSVGEATPEDLHHKLAGASLFSMAADAANEVLGVLVSARTDKDHPHLRPEADPEPFTVEQPPEPPPVQVELLGPYRIDVGGEELRSGLRAKARELLAFYLLHPDGTTLDAATEALWPEADPRRGSEWFWTALGNLRSRLRATLGQNQLKVIEREGDRYRIEPVFGVDVWRFQQALAEARASTTDADREAALDRAAAAYGGELLAGVDWPWVEIARDDLRRRAVDVLVTLADIRWKAGNSAGAWEALERAIEVDPYAEQVYRRVMRLHARLSRPHEAAETYRTLEARLAEFDLEPTSESQALLKELSAAE